MKIKEEILQGEYPEHISEQVQNLMGLTGGHLSGIIVCDEQVLVLDWEGQHGLPYFSFSYAVTFLEPEQVTLAAVYRTEDVRTELPGTVTAGVDGQPVLKHMEIMHDDCGDIPSLFGYMQQADGSLAAASDKEGMKPLAAWCYRLEAKGESLLVIAPDRWL